MTTTLYQSNAFMTSKVEACIKVLQSYLIPDSGLTAEDALNEIIGLLDNEEIVDGLSASKNLMVAESSPVE